MNKRIRKKKIQQKGFITDIDEIKYVLEHGIKNVYVELQHEDEVIGMVRLTKKDLKTAFNRYGTKDFSVNYKYGGI